MATQKDTVAAILDTLAPLPVRARAMFGEYGLYCDERFVALICNDTLYVKPTPITAEFLSDSHLAPPYDGAKDHYAVPADRLDDREWLQAFISRTASELPPPKPKKPKKSS